MLELQPEAVTVITEATSPASQQPNGLPDSFWLALPTFTGPQRAFLVARCNARSAAEAARIAGVKEETVYSWRYTFPVFRECEQQLLAAKGDAKTQLARAMYQAAMPEVAWRQVNQATEDHKGLSDRELMAQQRARDAVTKGAGMGDATGEGEERLDLLAIRLWRSKRGGSA